MVFKNNEEISRQFYEMSLLLEKKGKKHQSDAYDNASEFLITFPKDICELEKKGEQLEEIQTIGMIMAGQIREYCTSGKINLLIDLFHESPPEDILSILPNMNPLIASDITTKCDMESYFDLLNGIVDGTVKNFLGSENQLYWEIEEYFSKKSSWLNRNLKQEKHKSEWPSVEVLLSLDSEFISKNRDEIKKSVPGGKATVIFSNSRRAKMLHKGKDWVRISIQYDNWLYNCTIITSYYGKLKGKRIVVSRESECEDYYNADEMAASPGFEPSAEL